MTEQQARPVRRHVQAWCAARNERREVCGPPTGHDVAASMSAGATGRWIPAGPAPVERASGCLPLRVGTWWVSACTLLQMVPRRHVYSGQLVQDACVVGINGHAHCSVSPRSHMIWSQWPATAGAPIRWRLVRPRTLGWSGRVPVPYHAGGAPVEAVEAWPPAPETGGMEFGWCTAASSECRCR